MGINLTPDQEAQREKRLSEIGSEISGLQDTLSGMIDTEADQFKTNDLNEAFWTYFNDQIVLQYEAEVKNINGQYVASPVLLSEIINAALSTGRLDDGPTIYPVKRIAEFDFGGLASLFSPRENNIQFDEATNFYFVKNGFNDSSNPLTSNNEVLTNSSTQFTTANNTNYVSGARYFLRDTDDSAIIYCTQVQGVSAPYTINFNYYQAEGVTFGPSGSINIGATILGLKSFSNTERANKIATVTADQNVLDRTFQVFQNILSNRLQVIYPQITALESNKDDNLDLVYVSGIRDFVSGIYSFQGSPDYSDTGINSVSGNFAQRDLDFASRLTSIQSSLVGSGKFYDLRYNQADLIGNKRSGSYAQYNNTGKAKAGVQADIAGKQSASGVYASN